MAKSFDGKVALITGAASGIGRVTAGAFAREGATILVCDVAAPAGNDAVKWIEENGGHAAFLEADVTDGSQVKSIIQKIDQLYGKLDFAVNNAGIGGVRASTAEYPETEWLRVLNVNLTGAFFCMKHEIPLMLKQKSGVIINVASVAGVSGFAGHSAYAASKHGLVGLTKTAALEYARHGIRINALCPAYTQTPMLERMLAGAPGLEPKLLARMPQGRFGAAEEVAAAALYLCGNNASFITGHSLVLDGGITAE